MKSGDIELRHLRDEWAPTFNAFLDAGLNFRHTFSGSIPMRDIDVAAEWEKERKAGSVQWGIFANGSFIGTTGLYSHRDIYRSFEFRILIGCPSSIGKGYGTTVTKLVLDWAFQRLNAHRVWLGVNSENISAVRCYENCGFKREGVLRDDIYCHGKYVDTFRMSVLESEWSVHVEA